MTLTKFLSLVTIAFAFLVLPVEKVQSDTPAVNFSQINPAFNISFSNNVGGFNLGYVFSTNSSFTVSALGYYDDFGNGFLNNHPVALYGISGNILASTVVTNADALQGLFRYNPITPVTLAANTQYVLGGVTGYDPGNPVDKYTHDPLDISFNNNIQFIANREAFGTGNGLVFPTITEISVNPPLNYGWFGPNMLIVAVPEPTTMLLLGSGLALAAAQRYRRMKVKPKSL